jgi:hypothetical protein
MFHLLNKNLNLQLFFLAILTGWAGWTIFTQMTLMPADGCMIIYHYIANLWAKMPILIRLCAFGMVITMTVAVNQHFDSHHFHDSRTYMPGVFLLLLLNFGKFLHTLTPAFLTLFAIALMMILYSPSDQTSKMKERIFTIGLIIAIATMLDISASGLALFLIMLIAINNVTSFKDILILLFGILFPYIYAFSIAFIANSMPELLNSWRQLDVFEPVKQFTHLRIIDYVAIGWFIVSIAILMIRDKRLLDNKLIVIRQAFNNVNMLLFSMFLFLWLGIVPLPTALTYLLLPVSIYMALAVTSKKQRYIIDLMIVSICVMLWF